MIDDTIAKSPVLNEIAGIRKRYGENLFILGHFYQNEAVLSQVDIIGDSYKLSVEASRSSARFIVFCGVHFMAESARILCKKEQRVFIPDPDAGCPMADMITPDEFKAAYDLLTDCLGEAPAPVLYVNSSAELKALTGERGGTCCTSSNASLIARSLIEGGQRVFFLPDRNLGLNIGADNGLKKNEMQIMPGKTDNSAKMYIWNGFCPIHQRFSRSDVEKARKRFPNCRILVHPESTPEVVAEVDGTGSTSQLFRDFEEAEAGATLVIGTEIEFVTRLATLRNDVTVVPLAVSRCLNMAKINEQKLLNTLLSMDTDHPMGEVFVEEKQANHAGKALQRMIDSVENSDKGK